MAMTNQYEQESAHLPKGQIDWAVPEEPEEETKERLQAFVLKLQAEAKRRVDRRIDVEKRWLDDLRQYHGKYTEKMLKDLQDKGGSQIFMNLTRPKTNRFIAKMWDLLFPTDDKNWGIQPTPVPELAKEAQNAMSVLQEARNAKGEKERELREMESANNDQQAQAAAAEMEELDSVMDEAKEVSDRLQENLREAQTRSDLMQDEIEDQLNEAKYSATCRDVIEDAGKIGIGILKGPVLGDKYRQRWEMKKVVDVDGNERTMYVLNNDKTASAPEVQRVDPWGFFPDPDYSNVEDGEGVLERHLMNKKQLRRLAKQPDIDKDAVRRLLKANPQDSAPSYLVDLNDLTKQNTASMKDTYHVWEYTGPVDSEDLEMLAEALGDESLEEFIEEGEIDPLFELHARIWFCQGEVLRFAIHPLDSNETIYSVFCPEKDESSPFGFGMPYLLRDPQAVLNASWRKLMDNSAFAVGPQILVNKKLVSPENGSWVIEAGKIWVWNSNDMAASGQQPFATFDIPSHIQELQGMIEMSRKEMDQVVDIASTLQEGDVGAAAKTTATGIALIMNAANIVYRRAVKNFDDDITVPMVRRFYHWNMQFSEKDYIKGDYEVDARGSGVLLVKEVVAQNLMGIATAFGDHPKYGEWLKDREILNAIFRAITIPSKQIVKTNSEYQEDLRKKAQDPAQNPELQAAQIQQQEAQADRQLRQAEIDAKIAVSEMDAGSRVKVAQLNFDEAMYSLAEKLNMSAEELQGRLDIAREKMASDELRTQTELDAKERALATEVAMAERTGKNAGGSI